MRPLNQAIEPQQAPKKFPVGHSVQSSIPVVGRRHSQNCLLAAGTKTFWLTRPNRAGFRRLAQRLAGGDARNTNLASVPPPLLFQEQPPAVQSLQIFNLVGDTFTDRMILCTASGASLARAASRRARPRAGPCICASTRSSIAVSRICCGLQVLATLFSRLRYSRFPIVGSVASISAINLWPLQETSGPAQFSWSQCPLPGTRARRFLRGLGRKPAFPVIGRRPAWQLGGLLG